MVSALEPALVGERDVVGKPSAEALPEFVEQGVVALLDRVFDSGEAYPLEAQLEHVHRYARLAELNEAMARMYGLERAEQLIGARLEDTLPRGAPAPLAFMRRVAESGFSIREVESAHAGHHAPS